MQPHPDPHAYLFDEGDRTMAEVTRLERRAADIRSSSARTADEALRVALIDDLQDIIGRLRTLQDSLRGLLRQSDTTRTALTAYRRATTIRGPDMDADMDAAPPELRSDLARLIADFSAQLAAHADRAVVAAREGRARDAFLAAGAMQELLNARAPALRAALAAMQSKRTHPAIRAEIRKAAALVPGGVREQVRALESAARARQARLDAIGEALRASTASRPTYSARGFVRPASYAAPRATAPAVRPGLAVRA